MNIETTKAAIHKLVDSTDYEAILNHTHAQFKRFKEIQETHTDRVFTIEELELIDETLNGIPDEVYERQFFLGEKLNYEGLTEEEHNELSKLVEKTEAFAVVRLGNLIQLSKMWNTTLDELMKYFDIRPKPDIYA